MYLGICTQNLPQISLRIKMNCHVTVSHCEVSIGVSVKRLGGRQRPGRVSKAGVGIKCLGVKKAWASKTPGHQKRLGVNCKAPIQQTTKAIPSSDTSV